MGTVLILLTLFPDHPPPDPLEPELARFPSLTECQEAERLAWESRRRLEIDAPLRPHCGGQYRQALKDCEQVEEVWDALWGARCRCCDEGWRRQRLAELREMLGEEDFWQGRMPLPIPPRAAALLP